MWAINTRDVRYPSFFPDFMIVSTVMFYWIESSMPCHSNSQRECVSSFDSGGEKRTKTKGPFSTTK